LCFMYHTYKINSTTPLSVDPYNLKLTYFTSCSPYFVVCESKSLYTFSFLYSSLRSTPVFQ
jgi:hypothetical protein